MIALHFILQSECVLLRYQQLKFTTKSISSDQERPTPSPSRKYWYLSLNLLNSELAYCWIPPSILVFLQFRLPNNLSILISPPYVMRGN